VGVRLRRPRTPLPLLHRTYQDDSVLLGSDRPGGYRTLVVTGPQRGRVWWLIDGGAFPYDYDGTPCKQPTGDFLSWVNDWRTGQGWWQPR
jgi:hypothetical protein